MQKGDWMGLGMVVAMVALFGAILWLAPDAPKTSFGPVDVGGGSMAVSAVGPTDEVVVSADLVKSGFITIHNSMGPAPADIIGTTQFLPEGHSEDVTIYLSQEMQPGLTYIALLHVDDGDGRFYELLDFPVMTNGSVIRVDFMHEPTKTTGDEL